MDAEVFWSRLSHEPSGCWMWTGALATSGYGICRFEGRLWQAHRLAYRLAHGSIDRRQVMHACDTPRCCNPAHLSQGTAKQNTRDRMQKGRFRVRPHSHATAKRYREATVSVTWTQAQEIKRRAATGESQRSIGSAMGISHTTVYRVLKGTLIPRR